MLDSLDYDAYAANLNTNFQLAESGREIKLIELTERKITPKQELFSLIFSSESDNFLEQKMHLLRHEKLGEGELFLVPISKDSDGYKYEAGFNRLLEG